jgi:hypothetical protein
MVADASTITTRRKNEFTQVQAQEALVGPVKSAMNMTVEGVSLIVKMCDDADRQKKLDALKKAVSLVRKSGRAVPPMTVYVSSAADVVNVAFIGDAAGNAEVTVFLGPNAGLYICKIKGTSKNVKGGQGAFGQGQNRQRGIADQAYDGTNIWFGNPKQAALITATIIHEIGHVAHEAASPGIFWDLKGGEGAASASGTGWVDAAFKVSQYGTKNPLEFVAEVFTGIVLGKTYDAKVMQAYQALGGP